jgi:hypothetical protein
MAVLDRVPVERITAEARQIELGRAVLTLLAGLFYVVGWLAAKLVNVVWFAFAWSWTAIKVGWKEGRASSALVSKGG